MHVILCSQSAIMLPVVTVHFRLPNRPVINTAIVSATVHSEGPPLPPTLDPPITLEYTLLETEERTKPVCVFWNHSLA